MKQRWNKNLKIIGIIVIHFINNNSLLTSDQPLLLYQIDKRYQYVFYCVRLGVIFLIVSALTGVQCIRCSGLRGSSTHNLRVCQRLHDARVIADFDIGRGDGLIKEATRYSQQLSALGAAAWGRDGVDHCEQSRQTKDWVECQSSELGERRETKCRGQWFGT